MSLESDFLQNVGFPEGRGFGEAINVVREMFQGGKSEEEVRIKVKALMECYKKMEKRTKPIPLSVALDAETEEELENLSNVKSTVDHLLYNPVVEAVAIMPDACPAGDVAVGCGIITENHILPAMTSSDLFCSMHATFFECRDGAGTLIEKLDAVTSFGPFPTPEGRRVHHRVLDEDVWENHFLKGLEEVARVNLGGQGDGNHFSYIGEFHVNPTFIRRFEEAGHEEVARGFYGKEGCTIKALVTHHGSRNLGAKVFARGMEVAVKNTNKIAAGIPKSGCWLEGNSEDGKAYERALEYVRRWTKANHQVIHDSFILATGGRKISSFGNEHNAIWRHNGHIYHGKGATPAWKNENKTQIGLIPLNMCREILLVSGLDNKDYLSFAPHGACKNRSRTATSRPFLNESSRKIDEEKVAGAFEEDADGLHIKWASGRADISEGPRAYKDASKVRREIQKYGLASIIGEIRPKGCMMAGVFERKKP